MNEIEKLEQAILALESQRITLGDAVLDAALGPLREKLESLKSVAGGAVVSGSDSQQRKLISVMFADVSGFTAISESMDAEDVRDTMNAVWQRLDAVIVSYGGHIDKHMGDGVMALWGVDESREDDPEQAIRAALEMQGALKDFHGLQDDVVLRIRIGINTGPVLLGAIGTTGEFTAMGDTVNLASRLEQAAPIGETMISHDTYRHVRGVFDVEPLAPLQVKGKAEPVQTYLVKAAKPRAFRLHTRGVEGVETHMVGRDNELRQLQQGFSQVAVQGGLHTFSVVGDAGLGKSRLLHEFNAWAEIQTVSWWLFQGRPSASMMNAPYALLRDIIAFRFQIQDSDSLAVAHDKLESGMAALLAGDLLVEQKTHFIGQLVGFDYSTSPHLRGILNDPRQIRSQALFYLRQLFETLAAQGPLVLMLDDLHWADVASLDALSTLITSLSDQTAVMVLSLMRPTFFERFSNWGVGFPDHLRIDLSPLSKDESRSLVGQILQKIPELPTALQELVVGGAEGNPFYVEELIKMLIDGKVIQPGEEIWKVEPERLAKVYIPPTLAEVLQARLDSLRPDERLALQRAAVVGRVFWDDAVAFLAAQATEGAVADRGSMQAVFASLQRKELVFHREVAAFGDTTEYIFKHTLLHEVTYDTLLKRQRMQYHAAAAQWLDRASGDRRGEYLALIADHHEKAGEMDKAASILFEAGERALRLSAFPEARNLFERVLTLYSGNPAVPQEKIALLELKLADAYIQLGEYPQAQGHAERAWLAAQAIDSEQLIASALTDLGEISAYVGNYVQAKSLQIGAVYLMRNSANPQPATLAHALAGLSTAEWRLGNLESARDTALESYEIASAIHETSTQLMALNRLGAVLGALGHAEDELNSYNQCLELATSIGNRERAAVALNNMGAASGELKDWLRAWDYFHQALALTRETGAQQSLALHLINVGYAGSYLGRLDESRNYLKEGIAIAFKLGAMPVVVSGVMYYALIEHAAGNMRRALQLLGMAKSSPASDSESEREMNIFLEEWNLDPQVVRAGLAEGAMMDFESEVRQIIM